MLRIAQGYPSQEACSNSELDIHQGIRVSLLCKDGVRALGTAAALSTVPGIEPLHICGSLYGLRDVNPEIILLDLIQDLTLHTMSEVRRRKPTAKLVVITNRINGALVCQLIGLGIAGILRKQVPIQTLLACIKQVYGGDAFFDAETVSIIRSYKRTSLTAREGELVALLTQGCSNKEIAYRMHLTVGTVKCYIHNLFQKLRVTDRLELALWGAANMQHIPGPAVVPNRITELAVPKNLVA
jgi:DNA-binding NarL/FixJ family response regulator